MIGSKIRDYKAEVIGLEKELEQLSSEINKNKYQQKIIEIKEKIEKSEPSLMFYGIYNAGKSTLLNAIFGEEVASVNDIPETHKVTLYEWGKYILADTPGLNGPPEDEVITAAEIRRHDIIMFVIDDSDNFDSDVITKKIIEILENGKPCIIVINRKNSSNKEQILGIKAKMNKNIKALSRVSQSFEFVDVDAETALKAKQQQKIKLLEGSNIRELEYCISSRLASVDSIKLLHVPLELMIELCKEIQAILEKEIQDEESRKLYKLKETLFQVREQVQQEFSISLNNMIARYSEEIYNQASENRHADIKEDIYEQQIQELAQRCMDKFSKESNLTLQHFKETCKMNLSLDNIPQANVADRIPKRQAEKDEIDGLLDCLEKVPLFIPTPIAIPIPFPMVVSIIKTLKKWIFGTGSGEVPDIDEWNRQQEEYVQKRSMALKELKNQISAQMEDFGGRVKKIFLEQLEAAYNEAATKVNHVLAEKEGKNLDNVQKQERVTKIESNIKQLLKEIVAGNL